MSILNWIKRFFEEDNGKPSSKRLWGTAIIVVFSIAYLKTVVTTQTLVDIPEMWALLLGGLILGMGVVSKMKGK